jgi:hypothetical protein
VFDALRSWQVTTGRAAAPERLLLDMLHGGGGGRALGAAAVVPSSREEVAAALLALCEVAPHWARREQCAAPGGGAVLRFSREQLPREVRAHLVAAAREAAEAARAQQQQPAAP